MLSPMFLLPVEEQHRVDDSFYDAHSITHWIDTGLIN
jgi:hypothetical protein